MEIRLSDPTAATHPRFSTALGCVEWLQTVPLINVAPSQGRVLEEVEAINASDIEADERLKIFECLLDAINFLQSELARKFVGHAVPLGPQEQQILDTVVALWMLLGAGYRRCFDAFSERRLTGRRQSLAIALQRSLWCVAQALNEHRKCHQAPPAGLWSGLYETFVLAERFDVSLEPVASPVPKAGGPTHCMSTLAQAVLLDASSANELTARQIAVTARWLDRWSAKVLIRSWVDADRDANAPREPLVIDLLADRGPSRVRAEPAAPSLRVVETGELSKSLRKRAALLCKGESPLSLGLGNDVSPQFAESLLQGLHRTWCEDRRLRNVSRRAAAEGCGLSAGMGSIHFHLTGTPFHQPIRSTEFGKIQHDEIATFGRVSTHKATTSAQEVPSALEAWSIVDESPAGLRIARISGESRFLHSQLVAVKAGNTPSFLLGTVRWLAVDRMRATRIGLRLLPGSPQGVSIRAAGINGQKDKFVPALLLGAVPPLHAPETLVLPVGWFKPERLVQVAGNDALWEARLTGLLDRGCDYERITFELA